MITVGRGHDRPAGWPTSDGGSGSMIVMVAGVAGSGKSTIGALLARELGWDFEDGDDLHPAANIAKMKTGHPLTDEDRRPWLDAVAGWIDQRAAADRPGVIACSALKRSYRDQLLDGRPELRMIFLEVISRDTLAARMKGRHGHFFRPEMLDSQLAAVEPPIPAERVIVVDDDNPPAEVVREIIERLGLERRS
jgi:gluconokinase